MTDAELIARLRDEQPVTQDFQHTMKCALMDAAADRIEQLVATNEELTKERDEADDLAKAAFADGASNNIRLAETSYRVKWLETKLTKAVEALERIAGVKGPYSHPFPEASEGYGAFAIVTSREAIAEIKGENHDPL